MARPRLWRPRLEPTAGEKTDLPAESGAELVEDHTADVDADTANVVEHTSLTGDDDLAEPAAARSRTAASRSNLVYGVIASVTITAILGTLAGWTGRSAAQAHDSEQRQSTYVEVAKQGALNLANVDAAHIDTDVQRILDSSTGNFLQQFKERSQGFADFVKQAQSKSAATIREAGLESEDGDRARVIVALSVKVSAANTPPEQQPRSWRLRVTVERSSDDSMKISDVEFVP